VTTDSRQIAEAAFRRVALEFSQLKSELNEGHQRHFDLTLSFCRQPGLAFDVTASLQEGELCLNVGESHFMGWFPDGDPLIAEEFVETLRGVLAGEVRLVEHLRSGHPVKGELQREVSGSWNRLTAWSQLRWPSLAREEIRILRNRPE